MVKRFAVLCGLSLGLMALGVSAATLTISSNTTWNDGSPAAGYDSVTIAGGVTLTFEIASGTCTYSGPTITGAGAVKKTGGGTLVFSGNNTFDGDLTVEAGTFQANSAGAFGSTKGKTICKRSNTSGPLLIFGATMETDEEFDLKSTNDSGRSPQFAAGTVVTLNGSLNLNSALNNWDVPANTAVIVNGNVSNGGTWGYGASPTTSMIYWNGDFVQTTTWYFNGGCHYLKGHFTTSGNASFNTRNGNYHFQGENVLNGTQVVHQEDANNLKYYLEGYDQTCSKMGFSHANDESWNSFVINSTSGNTWHVKSGDSAIAAQFTGNVGLSCEGGTQYILKESTSTGTLTVKGGAVVEMLTAGADPYPKNTKTASWAGDIAVEAGSTLKVNASSSISPLAKISVSGEGATLQLAADIVLLGKGELWLDGARAQTGVWGAIGSGAAHESARLAGKGTITVPVRSLVITEDMLEDGVYTVATAAEYSGITVSAPATIRGAALTVLNLGTVTVNANATFECPLVFGKAANESVAISVASGVEARFSGAISGPADITSGGAGTVYFAGANTFTGKLTVEAGKFHAVSDGAFGAADGKTVCNTGSAGAPELFFDGITTAEPLSLASGNSKIHLVGENTFNADIELTKSSNDNQQQWDFQKGSKTVFNGALKDVDNCALFMGFVKNETPWGEIFFNGGVTIQNVWYFQRGIIHYGGTVSANKFRARGPMTAYLECAQLSTVDIAQEDQAGNISYVLDACDSSITGIARGSANNGGEATRGNKMMSFTSAKGYTLHVTGANKTDSLFYGTFTGNVGASFEGAGSEIVLGGANTSTGTLTAKNGHVVRFAPSSTYTGLADTGSWAGEISVEAGSTVELNSAANLTQTTDIRVAGEGATLQLNADVALVGSCGLWFDGERAEAGVWGAIDSGAEHKSAHISGTGTITVPARPLEITADMLDDGVYTVTSAAEYSGIEVLAPATIRGAALTVLDLGTVIVGANATFECPLVFGKTANESVRISVASGVEARFSGVISGPASITSGGAGKVYFSGANTFAGTLTVESGSFYADSDGAFGAATGMTICDSTSAVAPHLYIRGITTSEPFRLSATSGDKRIHFSGENTLNGAVEISPTGNQAWDFQSSSKTTFNGAISSANGVNFMGYGADNTTSEIFFNGGVSIPGIWYFQRGATHFGTTLSASSWRARGPQTVYLECAQLCTCNVRQEDLAGSISYVLNTCDSSIPGIDRGSSNNGNTDAEKASILANTMLTFTSANGYTLHVTGANKTDSLFYGTFTGNVGASFEGAGSEIVLGGANTSTGTLTAKNGHVVRFAPSLAYTGLADTGSWAGEISVEAGSTVELNSAANLTATTKIRVTGENAKLQLNADVMLGGAGELWLGGVMATSGEWGSVESGAAHTSEYLSGTGRITVPAQPLVITEDMLEDGVYTATEPKEYSAIIVSAPATIRGAALTIAGIDGLAVNANATFENALVVGKAANAQIQINVATNVELHVTGVVSGLSDILTAGEGSIFFSGENTFDGNLTIGGKTIFYADSDAAFGSTAGWTKCDTDTGAALHFRGADGLGIATAEPFILHDDRKGRIWFDGLTNTLNGSITLTGENFNLWRFPKATTTFFNCPVTNAVGARAGFYGDGYIDGVEPSTPPFAKIHWNGPVKCAQQFYFLHGEHYIDGNLGGSFAGLAQFNPRGGNYFFSGPNALGSNVYLQPESGLAQNHHFSECDQTIGYFNYKDEAQHDQPPYYITSKDGRTLNVVDTEKDQTCLAICMDSISLNFVGSKNVDILRANTSTGMLSVVSGATAKFSSTKTASKVDFTNMTGSWAGDVTVGSDSKLTLAAGAFTGRKGTLFLEGNAIIDIPAGLEVRVGSLRIDGELQPRGYYGSTVSGLDPAVKAHFTGEGVLRAAHGNQGAVLIVR